MGMAQARYQEVGRFDFGPYGLVNTLTRRSMRVLPPQMQAWQATFAPVFSHSDNMHLKTRDKGITKPTRPPKPPLEAEIPVPAALKRELEALRRKEVTGTLYIVEDFLKAGLREWIRDMSRHNGSERVQRAAWASLDEARARYADPPRPEGTCHARWARKDPTYVYQAAILMGLHPLQVCDYIEEAALKRMGLQERPAHLLSPRGDDKEAETAA